MKRSKEQIRLERAMTMVGYEFIAFAKELEKAFKSLQDFAGKVQPKNVPHDPRIRKNRRSW